MRLLDHEFGIRKKNPAQTTEEEAASITIAIFFSFLCGFSSLLVPLPYP